MEMLHKICWSYFVATLSLKLFLPVIELEARSPVGGAKQSLDSAGKVNKQIAHEEKPEQAHRKERRTCVNS